MTRAQDTEGKGGRRAATIGGIDARLTVWGQAARDGSGRRGAALVEGALLYVEKVGRAAESLPAVELDPTRALLDAEVEGLVLLAGNLLPHAVTQSCRLLWVDGERLREKLAAAVEPHVEAARAEVRRRQALYRRRARLWKDEQARLDELREEVEALRVPRGGSGLAERIARGLLERSREPQLGVRPGSIARWIAQLDERISA